jgi:hypothetical protein
MQQIFDNSTCESDMKKNIMLRRIEEDQQKEMYFKLLIEDNRKQQTPSFKEQMIRLDEEMAAKYPQLFKGLHLKSPEELDRIRKPTFPRESSIFRRHFIVDINRNIVKVPDEKPPDEENKENQEN